MTLIRSNDDLERMQANGTITPADADEVRTFIAFLHDVGPNREHLAKAYAEHYPDDYATAVAAPQHPTTEGDTP